MLRWFSPILVGALLLVGSIAHAQTAKNKAALQAEINSSFPDNTVGQITPAIARAAFSDFLASWQQYTAVNPQVGVTYTFAASDYGQLVTFNNASPVAVTLPNPSTTGFNPWNTYVRNLGAGTVTITPTGANIAGSATLVLTQNQAASIVSDGTNYQTWFNSTATALGCGSLPALTGDVNSSAGSCATSVVSKSILVDAQTGASYVIPPTDNQKLLTGTNGGAQAYSIAQAGGSFPARWQTVACSYGAGTITVTPTTSTINGAASLAIPTADCFSIVSNGTNYQAFEQGLFTSTQGDGYFTKGIAVIQSNSQNFQLNITGNGFIGSNYSAGSTIIMNDPVTHTGSNNFALGISALMPGSSSGLGGGSADGALAVSAQQTNYLTSSPNAEIDTLWCTNYQGVNATGNCGTFSVVKRANGSSVPGNSAGSLEGAMTLVNGSGLGAGTIADIHFQIGQLVSADPAYGAAASFESWTGVVGAGVRVDTFDNSAGTAGSAPAFTCAFEGRKLRSAANRYLCIDTTGVATLGTAGSAVGKVAFLNATSGSITLQPTTGALGSSVISLPAATGTVPLLSLSQTFTAQQIFSSNTNGVIKVIRPDGAGSFIVLDTPSTSQQDGFNLASNGVVKWQFIKQADDTFIVFDAAGAVTMQTYTTGSASTGFVTMGNTTAATSSITGAFRIGGGLGVAGAGWFGTYMATTPTTVAALPTCVAGLKAARWFVTDNNTALSFSAVITTGGAIQTPVYCDGSTWRQGANDNLPADLMRKFA